MKRILSYSTIFCIAFALSSAVSFAATSTLSVAAPIVGSALWENAWNLIFDHEVGVPWTNEVSINANTLVFAGNFWSENAGWCTFNSLGGNSATLTGNTNNLIMQGFAWCQNAGWVSFNPTWSISPGGTDVFFDKSQWKFHGYAWSENIGWINMEGLMTDITAPDINNFGAFAASGSKVLTITDSSPVVPVGGSYSFLVENWNSIATSVISSSTKSFTHDFRKAKQYYLKITDPFGNSAEWNVQVVADIPSDSLSATNIGAIEASSFVSTFAGSKVADASDIHSMTLKLRDQYGNPVINEPGIKTVHVRVAFNNNVDKDQSFLTVWVLGDAIQFPLNTFAGLSFLSGSIGTDSNTSGDYTLNISSFAPTKAGYAFTNNDNISLQKLSYDVVVLSGNSWVGEVSETDKTSSIGTTPLKFSPALYVGSVTNTDNWTIRQGYDTTFQVSLLTGTTVALSSAKIANILDIDANILMSYQNPSVTAGWTEDCNGYMKTITTFNGLYTSNGACNRPNSSNLLISPTTLGSTLVFSWKPTIVYAAPPNSSVSYKSEISYINGSDAVKYPSYSRSNNAATLADGTTPVATGTGVWVVNQSVKVLGMTTGRNTLDVLEGNDTNKVGSLTRSDIKNAIHQNVQTMTVWGVPASARYVVYTGDKTINSWPDNSKDTIIIRWGNLTITGDIAYNSSAIRGIIVLKDDADVGGNIYIGKNVSNIHAVVYADKSLISGAPGVYYSDTQTATGQLFLEGSVISDNTIGGASMMPLKCPYGTTGTCNDQEAKRYDLNYFRFYDGTGTPAAWVPAAGAGYPFVIEYDNRLQTAPPPGFQIAQ